MNTFVELAPYAAFLAPAIVLAAMNLWLMLTGEEGTLFFPTWRPYPAVHLPPLPAVPVPKAEKGPESRLILRKAA
jgi:hypothetical protein